MLDKYICLETWVVSWSLGPHYSLLILLYNIGHLKAFYREHKKNKFSPSNLKYGELLVLAGGFGHQRACLARQLRGLRLTLVKCTYLCQTLTSPTFGNIYLKMVHLCFRLRDLLVCLLNRFFALLFSYLVCNFLIRSSIRNIDGRDFAEFIYLILSSRVIQ